jgi:hypothetical protein
MSISKVSQVTELKGWMALPVKAGISYAPLPLKSVLLTPILVRLATADIFSGSL